MQRIKILKKIKVPEDGLKSQLYHLKYSYLRQKSQVEQW